FSQRLLPVCRRGDAQRKERPLGVLASREHPACLRPTLARTAASVARAGLLIGSLSVAIVPSPTRALTHLAPARGEQRLGETLAQAQPAGHHPRQLHPHRT